jgi:hypothetical protein
MIPRKKPTPKEVRGLIALRYKIAGEAFKLVKRARKNPKLLEKLKAWATSLTTSNCGWGEYRIVQDLLDQGLMHETKEAVA